jgi:hypothetical protein
MVGLADTEMALAQIFTTRLLISGASPCNRPYICPRV